MSLQNATFAKQGNPGFTPVQSGLLQRKCTACGIHTPGGETCTSCAEENKGLTLQKKLSIGESNNPLEAEADRVADQALAISPSSVVGEALPRIQRFSSQAETGADTAPESVHRTLSSGGAPLDVGLRQDMASRFGHDFSGVRVHIDGAAAQSARDVDASAYTVGSNIVFGSGQYVPGSGVGRHLLAHELTHVVQQGGASFGNAATLQRVPAAPRDDADKRIAADRSKVDIPPIADIDASPGAAPKTVNATVKFSDPAVVHMSWMLYDPTDNMVDGFSTTPGSAAATSAPFVLDNTSFAASGLNGRCLLRCVGLNNAHSPISYADRHFYVWKTTPTGVPPDIATLERRKTDLEKVTKSGSKKSFSQVGKSFAELKDIDHDLAVLKTGTGTHVGNKCAVKPPGSIPSDCTNIVLEVLGDTFAQQGKAADWAKVKAKIAVNTGLGGRTKMSGIDLQAALQSEAGWKGIFWAPDPSFQVPADELVGARSDEASDAGRKAKSGKGYYVNNPKKGYPGVGIDKVVDDYAPESPRPGKGTASTTVKTTTQLEKLKKLPFGVMSAHGGYHMTLIMNGKVLEVHWSLEATNIDLIEETDLEKWAVGEISGFHYYASGAIVAPAAEVDAAFK